MMEQVIIVTCEKPYQNVPLSRFILGYCHSFNHPGDNSKKKRAQGFGYFVLIREVTDEIW